MQRSALALVGFLLFAASGVRAQSYVESALMFSRTVPGGSARIQGMGSSQTALGGDYSSAYSNPAGLGMFNRSEITFTPAYSGYKTKAAYLGETDEATDSRFNIPGLSGVFHLPMQNSGGFISGSLGLSMTRINDFNQSTYFHGQNINTSIIDSYIDNAFGSTTAQFQEGSFNYDTPTGLAYNNYLIGPQDLLDPTLPNDEYFTHVTGIPDQQESFRTKGAANQWNFAYGANYKDKIFVGLGIGLVSLKYKNERTYIEDFADDLVFNNLQLNETLDISGNGINATLGVIARPVDFLQIGASFSTPTHYEISEIYEANMSSSWKNFDYYGPADDVILNEIDPIYIDPPVVSDYSLTTPLKFSAGLAYISKHGLITADVDFVNPANAKYSSNMAGVTFDIENDDIRATFASAINYRIGGEYRYKKLRARAGYGVQGNTFNSSLDLDNSIKTISGGIGIRIQKFYSDFAIVHSSGTGNYQPYILYDGAQDTAELDMNTTTGMITFGFTF